MVRKVEILRYKSLKYEQVFLSPFAILIGPNGSGKSTFLDTFSLIKDIFDADIEQAIYKRCKAPDELLWGREGEDFQLAFELQIPEEIKAKLKEPEYGYVRYEIAIRVFPELKIERENLYLKKEPNTEKEKESLLFPEQEVEVPENIVLLPQNHLPQGSQRIISRQATGKAYFESENTGWNITYTLRLLRSSLSSVPEDEEKFPVALWLRDFFLEGVKYIHLNNENMRRPCPAYGDLTFSHDGSNLPRIVKKLQEDPSGLYQQWFEHVQTTLTDIEKIEVAEREEDRSLFLRLRYRNIGDVPSWGLSDGTLRLLAQTLIPYLPQKNLIYMIEEPENGLHPLAIETVFNSLSSAYNNQILVATHSPLFLQLADLGQILCFAKTETGVVDIIQGDKHPRLKQLKGTSFDLAVLYASGVLQ